MTRHPLDTRQLDDLLALEWQAHFWTKLDVEKVVYFDGSETLEKEFPDLLETANKLIIEDALQRKLLGHQLFRAVFPGCDSLETSGFSRGTRSSDCGMPTVSARLGRSWQEK